MSSDLETLLGVGESLKMTHLPAGQYMDDIVQDGGLGLEMIPIDGFEKSSRDHDLHIYIY